MLATAHIKREDFDVRRTIIDPESGSNGAEGRSEVA